MSILEIIAFTLAYLLALVVSFSMHEFSHAFVAYKAGDPTAKSLGRVSLNPFNHIDPLGMLCFLFIGFGWAKPVQINPLRFKHYKRDMAFVSLAGIFVNLVLAFVFSGIYFFAFSAIAFSSNTFMVFLTYFLSLMIQINLALFIFNLLPIYPLDGFNFLSVFLKPDNAFVQFMKRYGSIILLIFIVTPLFDYIYSFVTNGVMNLFFGFWGLFTWVWN